MTRASRRHPAGEEMPEGKDPELREAFRASVSEGQVRLGRSWSGLAATGLVGGIDVSLGVLALLVIEHATGSRELGALGFSIGFIALTLGRSELFTENFLVPVASVVARAARPRALLRLWAGTAAANLAGGWVFAWLLISALPRLRPTAVETARFVPELGIGWESFSLGMLAGVAITVMTWMERSSQSELGRIVAAIAIGFLLAGTPLNHVIVVSVEMFAAIQTGAAPFGYEAWAATAGWAALANMVGGLSLVTLLRLIQVGGRDIEAVGGETTPERGADTARRGGSSGGRGPEASGTPGPGAPGGGDVAGTGEEA